MHVSLKPLGQSLRSQQLPQADLPSRPPRSGRSSWDSRLFNNELSAKHAHWAGVADVGDNRVPEVARACLSGLGAQLRMLKAQILGFDRRIMAWHRSNEMSRRLDAMPGIGPVLATALVASVADATSARGGTSQPGSGSCRSS